MATTKNNNNTIDNTDNMALAIAKIGDASNLPATLKDPFEIFSMFEKNNKFEDMNGRTVKPLVIWFNEESYKDGDSGEVEDDIKTYILCSEGEEYAIYSGFSVTMRLKLQLLQNVFGNNLPEISIAKVSKGMKQEYSITPIKPAK